MAIPFADLLVREQQLALVGAVVSRMAELGMLTGPTASMSAASVAEQVVGTIPMDGHGADAFRRALATRIADSAATIGKAVTGAVARSKPVVTKAGKAAAGAASTTGSFVFETTREVTRRLSGPVYGPSCPKCGEPTVIRRNKRTGHVFAACSGWEETGCPFTAKVSFTDDK